MVDSLARRAIESDISVFVDRGIDRVRQLAEDFLRVVQHAVAVGVVGIAVTVGVGIRAGQAVGRQQQSHDGHVRVVGHIECGPAGADIDDLRADPCLGDVEAEAAATLPPDRLLLVKYVANSPLLFTSTNTVPLITAVTLRRLMVKT